MLGKRLELLVKHHRARRRIVIDDQRTRIVDQDFLRHPAKLDKRALQPIEPALLPLIVERPDVRAPRIAERSNEQIGAYFRPANFHQALAEVCAEQAAALAGDGDLGARSSA